MRHTGPKPPPAEETFLPITFASRRPVCECGIYYLKINIIKINIKIMF